jgi:hypothetical protein
MINPFSRTNFRNSGQWKARAQAIQDRIKDWSISELMHGRRIGEAPRPGLGSGHGPGYDRNQPRVPAGHSDGGQWTKMGAHTRAVAPVARSHDQQAFFGGFAHGDVHFGGADARALSRTNYAAAVDRYDAEPSVEVLRVNDAGLGTIWRGGDMQKSAD